MENRYIVNEQDLKAIADVIRNKTGKSSNLIFPTDFISNIETLKTNKPQNIFNTTQYFDLPTDVENGTIAIFSAYSPGSITVSDSQVENPEPYDLWFLPSNLGNIMYILNNQTYFISIIRQYINNEWVAVPAVQFWDGEWTKSNVILLKNSEYGTDYTGGWGQYFIGSGTSTIVENGFKLVGANNNHQWGGVQSLNKIDITNYNKIIFRGTITAYGGDSNNIPKFGIQENSALEAADNLNNFLTVVSLQQIGSYEVIVPVESYKGSYYIGTKTGGDMIISNIELEV